eukprot:g142.t1
MSTKKGSQKGKSYHQSKGKGGSHNQRHHGKRQAYYEPHLSTSEVKSLLTQPPKSSQIVIGRLRINAKNRSEAYVIIPEVGMDLFVEGDKMRNRALNGDIVAVKLLPKDKWRLRDKGSKKKNNNNNDNSSSSNTKDHNNIDNNVTNTDHHQQENNDSLSAASVASSASTSAKTKSKKTTPKDDPNATLSSDVEALAQGVENLSLLWNPVFVPKESEKKKKKTSVSSSSSESNDKNEGEEEEEEEKTRLDNMKNGLPLTFSKGNTWLKNILEKQSEPWQPSCKVVHIVKRQHSLRSVGILEPFSQSGLVNPNDKFARLRPLDGRIPYVLIPLRSSSTKKLNVPKEFITKPENFHDRIFLGTILVDHWSHTSRFPLGKLQQCVGQAGNPEAETKAILFENDLDSHGPFSSSVENCLREFMPTSEEKSQDDNDDDRDASNNKSGKSAKPNWQIPEDEIRRRLDLRHKRIFTIDPTTAKDLDDALHITPIYANDDGKTLLGYEIGVHIADVSYFVKPNNALDREAARRATSVYLVQKVLPMLPRLLCEQLCSLNPNVDRLAYSCIWRMRPNGTMWTDEKSGNRPWFGRTVIRSCCKLDYSLAQRMIDDDVNAQDANNPDAKGAGMGMGVIPGEKSHVWPEARWPTGGHNPQDVINDVKAMHRVAMQRRRKRFSNSGGALKLHRDKLSFVLDGGSGMPVSVKKYPIGESNQLIEEYMLLANFLVAEQLILNCSPQGLALIRKHPPPLEDQLHDVQAKLANHGYSVDITSAGRLHASLERLAIQHKDDPYVYSTLTAALIGPMKPAEYMAVGMEEDPNDWRHYALSIPYYTHFTSPIRRYADVMVHRLLTSTILSNRGNVERQKKTGSG